MSGAGWFRELDVNGRRAFRTTYAGFSIEAMSVQVYAFIIPTLLATWHLTTTGAGTLAAVGLASSAVGGWLAGVVSDRIGRVRVLQITVLWLVVASALCGLAQSYHQLLVARVMQGFGFGAEWAVGAVFMGEIASASTRGRLVGTAQSAWAVGWALSAIVSSAALAIAPAEFGWRLAFFAAIPPAMIVFARRCLLAESATFLSVREAHAWHAIFGLQLRGNTARGLLLAVGTHGGYWAVATWWPTMLQVERGLSSENAMVHMAVLVGGSFAGYLIGAWLSDHIGRRATIIGFATIGMAIALVATELPISNATLLIVTAPLGMCLMGLYSTIGPVLTELYPTRLRGSGLGFCYNGGRAVAGITPLAIGGSVASFGISHSIGIYLCVAYGLVLLAALLLKETRGIDLSSFDIQAEAGAVASCSVARSM